MDPDLVRQQADEEQLFRQTDGQLATRPCVEASPSPPSVLKHVFANDRSVSQPLCPAAQEKSGNGRLTGLGVTAFFAAALALAALVAWGVAPFAP